MICRRFIGILCVVVALASLSFTSAQTKSTTPAQASKAVMKPVDINTASEEDIAAVVGVDRATAKKIVDGRPYRNKTELTSRGLLSKDQYNKVKDDIIARQPPAPVKK